MNKRKCFIVGLPSAGKTTFLAALWYSLCDNGKTILNLKKLIGNQKYLSDLSSTWAGFDKVSRTSIYGEQEEITVLLSNNDGDSFEVSFPDLSGESFQKQYTNREINKRTADSIVSSDSFLLFINPLSTTTPCLISNIRSETRTEEDNVVAQREASRDDPTAVQLVELLQFIKEIKGDSVCDIAIIISAWDLEDANKYVIPETYVKKELSLLWQYLFSNKSQWRTAYYGVSAQGGSLETPEDIQQISQKVRDPINRIMIVNNDGEQHNDLTILMHTLIVDSEGRQCL